MFEPNKWYRTKEGYLPSKLRHILVRYRDGMETTMPIKALNFDWSTSEITHFLLLPPLLPRKSKNQLLK